MCHFDAKGPHQELVSQPLGSVPISSLSWSPWLKGDTQQNTDISHAYSVISYATHEYIGLRRIDAGFENSGRIEVTTGGEDIGGKCGWIGSGAAVKWEPQVSMVPENNIINL
jgi:hypothetical protein